MHNNETTWKKQEVIEFDTYHLNEAQLKKRTLAESLRVMLHQHHQYYYLLRNKISIKAVF